MKRHPAFVELSRDHHDGLLLATRLQQGSKALLKLWSHDPKWQAEFVVSFFREDLVKHFRLEEEILFPEIERAHGGSVSIVKELRDDHQELRRLARSLERGDAPGLERTLAGFGRLLERHIRREERELFPECERTLSPDVLEDLGRRMNIK